MVRLRILSSFPFSVTHSLLSAAKHCGKAISSSWKRNGRGVLVCADQAAGSERVQKMKYSGADVDLNVDGLAVVSHACPECEGLKKEVAKAELLFGVAHRSFHEDETGSSLEEYLRRHQAVLVAQRRLVTVRDILDRHLQTHQGEETDQVSNDG
jgi:hypothetical protein